MPHPEHIDLLHLVNSIIVTNQELAHDNNVVVEDNDVNQSLTEPAVGCLSVLLLNQVPTNAIFENCHCFSISLCSVSL